MGDIERHKGNDIDDPENLRKEIEKLHAEMSHYKRVERNFKDLIYTINDIFWKIDAEDRYIYVSSNVSKVLGYHPSEMMGRTPFELAGPGDMARDKEIFNSYKKDRKPFRLIMRTLYDKNGNRATFEASGIPLFNGDGRFIGYLGVDRDVTLRKRSEEALILDESRLEALLVLNQMTDASVKEIADFALEEGVRLTRSRAGYLAFVDESETNITMYAWSREGLRECRVENRPFLYNISNMGLWGEPIRQHRPVITNDYHLPITEKKGCPVGHMRIDRHMGVPIMDNDRVVLLAGVANKADPYDASDLRQLTLLMGGMWRMLQRKKTEEALRISEEKFRVLTETSSAAIFIYKGNKIQFVNTACVNMLGYSKEELLSMNYWDFVHPEYKQIVHERGTARQQGKAVQPCYELKVITRAGETKWLEATMGLMYIRGEKVVLITAFDITERKSAEASLQEAKAQVELYLDLMGHDINNMNQVARGYLDMLLHSPTLSDTDHNMVVKSLDVIKNSSRIIDNVMKLQLARGDQALVPMSLGNLLEEARLEYSNYPGKSVEIVIHNPYGAALVMANDLLSDVFANLFGNSVKYSPPDRPVMIKVSVEEEYLEGRAFFRITIDDNGPGIPDEMKNKIFWRTQRGTTQVSGKGLGLYLVRTLIERYGGMVSVADRIPGRPSCGARFILEIPQA